MANFPSLAISLCTYVKATSKNAGNVFICQLRLEFCRLNGYLCVRLLIGFGIDSIESLLKRMVWGAKGTLEKQTDKWLCCWLSSNCH